MKEYGLYINGQWCESTGEDFFETINPATGEVLAKFPSGTGEDVENAVDAAERALGRWRKKPAPKRAEILLEIARLLRKNKDELGALVTIEMGKIISEGKGDVQEGIDIMEYIAGEGRRLFGETTPSELTEKFCMTTLQPIGVVGLITPWNFPFAIPCWKLAPALIAGNTVVFKPASGSSLCAAKLVEILEKAGVPPGVVNFVTGSGHVVGKSIIENQKVKMISFTGGVPTGFDVYGRASRQLKPVHLELGGKNPQIIMDDANIDLAIEGVLFGAFGSSGQRCTATSRLIVHKNVYNEVLERLKKRTSELKIGDPIDPEVDMGPVTSISQEEKILEYIEIGKKEGAGLILGGNKMKGGIYDRGYFIEPTIFEAEHGMRITKEEIFGPVLSVIRADSYEDALRIANDVDYGLSSSIYTKNINLAFRAINDLESGITYINAPTIGAEVHLPFGGIKNTGAGGREAGTAAIKEFTELKTIFIDYSDKLQKAQIDS